MYRILEILIEDFENQKPSEAYQLAQHKFCEAEKAFMDSLSDAEEGVSCFEQCTRYS